MTAEARLRAWWFVCRRVFVAAKFAATLTVGLAYGQARLGRAWGLGLPGPGVAGPKNRRGALAPMPSGIAPEKGIRLILQQIRQIGRAQRQHSPRLQPAIPLPMFPKPGRPAP